MNPFTHKTSQSVAALGEGRLITEIRKWLGKASPKSPFGIGDDCAVVPAGRSAQLITVDPVIYGEHFDDKVPARGAGAKLFKRNLSDIAAMGGIPRAAVVALALDSRTRTAWLRDFYKGLAKVATDYGVPVVGGDIAHHKGGIVATLTLVGETSPKRFLTREGARAGDFIFVTGQLGGSLKSGHHYKFNPRLAQGAWLAARPEVRSMMDLSDGIAKDLRALCPKNALPALIPEEIPCRKGCDLRAALCDGEDYELLFTVDHHADLGALSADWHAAFPGLPLSLIGFFTKKGHMPDGALNLDKFRGFEHLVR